MSAPLDIFGQPVSRTKPVGPQHTVYHSSSKAVSPVSAVNKETNTTWYTQKAAAGGFRLTSHNRGFYNAVMVDNDPRNSEKMSGVLAREYIAIKQQLGKIREETGQDLPVSIPTLADANRAIIKDAGRDVTVASLMRPFDADFQDQSPIRRRRRRLDEMIQAQHDFDLGIRSSPPTVEEFGHPRKQGYLGMCDDDVEVKPKPSGPKPARVVVEVTVTPKVGAPPTPVPGASRASLSSAERRGVAIRALSPASLRTPAPASYHKKQPVASALAQAESGIAQHASVNRMEHPVWSTMDARRAYPFQKQMALRQQLDDAAIRKALAEVSQGHGPAV